MASRKRTGNKLHRNNESNNESSSASKLLQALRAVAFKYPANTARLASVNKTLRANNALQAST